MGRGRSLEQPLGSHAVAMSRIDALIEELDGPAPAKPPNVALMHLIMNAARADEVGEALARGRDGSEPDAISYWHEVERLWREHPEAWSTIRSSLAEHGLHATSADEALRRWSGTFDRLAKGAPDSAVALYAL